MATSTRRAEALQRLPKHYQKRRAHQHDTTKTINPSAASATANTTATTTTTTTTTSASANSILNASSVAAKHAHVIATQVKTRNSQNILQQPSPPRMKRPLDPIANNYDPHKPKRARITVEILSRPIPPNSPPKSITVKSQSHPHPQPHPKPQPPTNNSTVAPTTQKPPLPPIQQQPSKTATATISSEPPLKKHKEKAINGIKHELDRLQPSPADTSSATERPGRKLRSQEATRFKSELSAYFPDYDEVIGNDPKEQHILNLDTPIVLIDTDPLPYIQSHPPIHAPHAPDTGDGLDPGRRPHFSTVRIYSDNLFTDLHDSQLVDFSFLEPRYTSKDIEDPLSDAYYDPVHKKAERLEKSIRNTEKGRAQHEKDQIIRLLNELQGHDWLRIMGVSGVTESRKKTFEPARDHFIKGCQAILEKFRIWSQEEKKRKIMKERALAEEADDPEEEQTDEENDEQLEEVDELDEDQEMADVEAEGDAISEAAVSDGDPPDYSDVDASAKQLHDEALARARYAASSSKRSRGEPPPKSPEPYVAKEFTSFFEKKHQRDAALSKGRRRGRTVMAWGHPIPDMMECDFDLPEEYLDSEILKAHERQKRRERRERKH
ncbi:something about silencing, SAS, complex subunit 4-domain-containing protein [Hypoxylon rubiginosum]|uniref:Something about silencing, SAS, complex subunit 4-domain-containing protein n=1 Tax=Hypoxylon rubiginosum TaxID=110542 RepID=A0ACB9YVC5_9PEZI|nr:something about silencing, SAS, complex subunit 4-domain-containing protein [Hypoxylon rubiginosum]